MQDKKLDDYLPNLPVKPIKQILKNYHKGETSEEISKRDVLNLCSLRATRRILRYNWKYDIPESTVKEVNRLFNEVLYELAESIIKAHIEQNERYKKYHIRPKLRLSVYKNVLDEILICRNDVNMGATGQLNRETVVSDKQEIEVT